MFEYERLSWSLKESGGVAIAFVCFSLFLDNMLLTVIVPILPDYIFNLEHQAQTSYSNNTEANGIVAPSVGRSVKKLIKSSTYINESGIYIPKNNFTVSAIPEDIINENGLIGILFASKAIVQLVANPIVGPLTNRIGYSSPLLAGTVILLTSSTLFAFGETYVLLLIARSIQGVASACITISGMAMVADRYPDDAGRSRVMGIALGGTAMGVLAGYPFGSFMYDFVGKTTLFLILGGLMTADAVLQFVILRPRLKPERLLIGSTLLDVLTDPYIIVATGAICVSTSSMAILEPCLPIWLMDTMSPSKWQLGTVFIPDSLGYLIGTYLFGAIAFRVGRWLTAMLSLLVVGVCAVVIPFSTRIVHLIAPHFGLGLGIGITDAALMPLLAYLVDSRHVAMYGSVYAVAQVAVCLAYGLGPLVAGQVVKEVGFPWLMRGVGILNLLYSPLCVILRNPLVKEENKGIMMDSPAVQDYESTVVARPYYSHFTDDDD